MNFRVGFGFDVHQLEPGIPFFLGGVRIEHHKGAKGHSDADVIIHAICDALLGAAALGDIGKHFPDTSNEFKGIDSSILLAKVVSISGGNWPMTSSTVAKSPVRKRNCTMPIRGNTGCLNRRIPS